ncbi:dienelactone hydrolase family protein [Chitinophaga flava]|uniref:Hydrolase n=1 Tax=Chitinophaga flava TaxID=2259036 RepID=A0A365XQE6_9BACT|nr:dienelactone hydrolase family protein [Chitinophaga flava]RBL88348.1 hydrolase [Chitinophaga flava]
MSGNGEIKVELKGGPQLMAILQVPEAAKGLVIFAHGSGSSRLSPRNNFVADILNKHQMATLLTDLLTPAEDEIYENRFNINLLSNRLIKVSEWSMEQAALQQLSVGYFGASTGAAAALQAAAQNNRIEAVVSRGGRPDLSKNLSQVQAPTLLIIGSLDIAVIELNKQAYDELRCEKKIEIVQGASHLFEEPGTLDSVSNLAADWFERYLIRKFPGSPL